MISYGFPNKLLIKEILMISLMNFLWTESIRILEGNFIRILMRFSPEKGGDNFRHRRSTGREALRLIRILMNFTGILMNFTTFL